MGNDIMKSDLSTRHCESCEGIGAALTAEQINNLMPQLDKGWEILTTIQQLKNHFHLKIFMKPWLL